MDTLMNSLTKHLNRNGPRTIGGSAPKNSKALADGDNYRGIQAETGTSLGAISSIIEGEKKRVPDIQELRQLNVALKKRNTESLTMKHVI